MELWEELVSEGSLRLGTELDLFNEYNRFTTEELIKEIDALSTKGYTCKDRRRKIINLILIKRERKGR